MYARPPLPLVAASALFTCLPLARGARAQQTDIPPPVRAAAERITAAQLARDLEYLSADALLGRNTPSPGFDTAAAYIARRLARAGLKPLGDNGSYFQHYDLRDETLDTAGAYLEIDGRRYRFGDDFVIRGFAGAVSGTLPVVYVGHGWTVPAAGIDPFENVDVRGKVLLVHGYTPPEGAGAQQIGRTWVNVTPPLIEAQRRGAVAMLFIPPAGAVGEWAEARRANLTRLELDPIVPSAYQAPSVTGLVLRPHVAEALLAGERVSGAELAARAAAERQPVSFDLQRRIMLHAPVARGVVHRPYNVVALLEGSDPQLRNEYVTIAAHLDGAVGRTPLNGDSIYNAADDNATGSAATLAIAEQLVNAPRPKRSLIFIWDSGEERGLWGTRRFVHDPPVPLQDIVAHINVDMIGATRRPGSPDSASAQTTGPNEVYLVGPGVLSARVDSLLERVNRAYLNLRYNRAFDRPDHEFFYPRTDAGPFLEREILTIGYFTGLHDRYHRPSDEARYLDPQKMQVVARTVLVSAWMLADSPDRPRIDKEIPATVPRHRRAPATSMRPARRCAANVAARQRVGWQAPENVPRTSVPLRPALRCGPARAGAGRVGPRKAARNTSGRRSESMTRPRIVLAAALLAAAFGAACSSAAAPPAAGPSPPAATPAPVRKANPADVHFMQGMIHHHAQALVIAGWSATHGASQAIRTLSERIIVSQTDEIKLMQQWLREMGEHVPEATPTAMKMNMGGREHEMLMPGMLTDEQMKQLDNARGAEFDRLFLVFMIQHHEGALKMVEDLFAAHGGGVDDFIYKIASDTFADQGSEIDRMQRMLDAMGAGAR